MIFTVQFDTNIRKDRQLLDYVIDNMSTEPEAPTPPAVSSPAAEPPVPPSTPEPEPVVETPVVETPEPPKTPVSTARLREVFNTAYAANSAAAMAASEKARAAFGTDSDHWTNDQISMTVTELESIATL